MTHMRRRLGSVSDNSAAPSSSSDTSEIPDSAHELELQHQRDLYGDQSSPEPSGELTEQERAQVESFFSGLGTEVFVSASLANLYECMGKDKWRLIYTGVPVLLHDKGSARSRSSRRVTFVLAERGTCFALWKDRIDNLSNFKQSGAAFHTMCLSTDHRRVIGFSYDSKIAAAEVWASLDQLMSDPENISLSVPGRKRGGKKPAPKKFVLPPKAQISLPCQFNHVTSVTQNDSEKFYSLQAFVPHSARRD